MTTNARDEKWSEWIEWSGGEPPVAGYVIVQVKLRNGGNGHTKDGAPAYDWRWSHDDGFRGNDIIAYRYKIEDPSGISEADEEECIQLAYERMNDESVKTSIDELRADTQKYSAYYKDVRHIEYIDVYRTVDLFGCEKHGHAISHAAKKLLLTGARTGGKDVETEVREAIDSLYRWLEMREEDKRAL